MTKSKGFIAAFVAAALSGCVVTTVPYRPAPPPPPPEPVAMEAAPAAVDADADAAQITQPPPPLPVYEQPPCPVAGYIWTPGLWRWGPAGYFWVPGTWVAPPTVGLLWTPGYWGVVGGVYMFHAGYWGPHVGFYGGINYGGGYVGDGYAGGRWVGNSFHYNTAVTNVNTTVIHNTYNQTVVNNITVVNNNTHITQTSYAGGPGTRATPNAQEMAVAHEAHTAATPMQMQHESAARANPELAAAHNQGRPPVAATTHAGAFSGAGVTAAKPVGTPWHPSAPPAVARNNPSNPMHPGGNAPGSAMPRPNSPAYHPPGAAQPHSNAAYNTAHPGQPAQAKRPPPQQQQGQPKAAVKGNPNNGKHENGRPEGEHGERG